MNNHKEKDYRKKKTLKREVKNIFKEEIIHGELFIEKCSRQKYDSDTFIIDYSAKSHMVTNKEKMTDLCYVEKRVIAGDSGTLTGKKCGNWHGYKKHDRKLHRMTLYDMSVIPGLHENLFSLT